MSSEKAEVQIIENTYIELSDGEKLSTRLWLPTTAGGDNPVPAIFEFLPYRKRDVTTQRDEVTYQVFAQNGYAGVRVDMRGCGDSTGLVQDEYVLQEQEDAVECINWIKQQPWCTGNVGMMGISWGGFNALQVAYHAPDALKAIIPVAFTDDRYEGDIHYKGGVMVMDNIRWAANMEIRYSLPPDPLFTDNWKEEWLTRLEALDPCLNKWMIRPLRDDYYKQGSVCEDYSRIKAATYLMAGMADGYSNNVTRTLKGLSCPKRAMVGPWVHLYPHLTVLGPKWDFCSEALQWWDRWLKEKKPEQEEPEFMLYLQNRNPSEPRAKHVDGKWICDPKTEAKMYFMNDGKLGEVKGDSKLVLQTKETVGFNSAGALWPTRLADLPGVQSLDDMESCYFETQPFTEEISFCGNPIVHLSIASDKPVASVFAKLCKVNEAGESIMLCYSAWNLNHDASHTKFTPLTPGEFQDVDIKLEIVSEKIEKGSKLRLCFTTGMFPVMAPNPEPTTFTLDLNKCHLDMPELKEYTPYDKPIPQPSNPSPLPTTQLSAGYDELRSVTDEDTGRVTAYYNYSTGKTRFDDHGLITEWKTKTEDSILPEDPTSAHVHVTHEANWSRGEDWRTNIVVTTDCTFDKDFYYTDMSRTVKYNDEIIFSRKYKNKFERNPAQ